MVVELAHRDPVRVGGPLGPEPPLDAEHGRARSPDAGPTGCASACPRAATIGARLSDAIATDALSMTRLTIISATSGSTATGSAATSAIFHASCCSRGRGSELL